MRIMKRKFMKINNKNGFTIIELLLTMTLLLIFAGFITLMLIKSKSYFQSSVTRTSYRQDIQIQSFRISKELRSSNVSMITNGGAQNRFSFASPYYNGIVVTDPATGSVIWQKFVVFYIYNGKLYRRDVLSVGATTPLTLAQLNTYCNGTGIVVSPSVNSISLVPSAQNNSATLTIITQAVNQNGNLDKQSIITTVYMYNN